MKEEWKDIIGYEELYQVSNLGNVRKIDRWVRIGRKDTYVSKGCVLKGYTDNYRRVALSKDGIKKTFYVHRLVALAFIPNPQNKPQVNHIDGDKTNNKASNLEWVTNQENMFHEKVNNLNKNTRVVIAQYDLDGRFKRKFKSISEASELTELSYSNIRSAVQGRHKSAGGFLWRYFSGDKSNLSIPEKISGSKDGRKEVHKYSIEGKYIDSYESVSTAAKLHGVSFYAISKCATGINKTSAGYVWKYDKTEDEINEIAN